MRLISDRVPKLYVEKKIKQYGAELKKEGGTYSVFYGDERIAKKLPLTGNNFYEDSLDKMSDAISKRTGKSKGAIYLELTKNANPKIRTHSLDRLVNTAFIVFLAGIVVIMLLQIKTPTGFTITSEDLTNGYNGILTIASLLAITGFLIYKKNRHS